MLSTQGSNGRFHEAAVCFRVSWPSSAEGADIISHQPVSLLKKMVDLNAAAKVLWMIRCHGRAPPSPNQYLITNKVKQMSSKVIHDVDPEQFRRANDKLVEFLFFIRLAMAQ